MSMANLPERRRLFSTIFKAIAANPANVASPVGWGQLAGMEGDSTDQADSYEGHGDDVCWVPPPPDTRTGRSAWRPPGVGGCRSHRVSTVPKSSVVTGDLG